MWRKQEEAKVPPSPQNVVVTPPASTVSNYSSQPSAQSSAPPVAQPMAHAAPAPKSALSVVCKGITIRGEVTGDEDLQIDGEMSGSVKLVGARVMIGPEGRVAGNIQAREIIVRGTLKGNLRASERILMGSTGRWEGDGVSPRLAIEEGATVRGNLEVAEAPEKKLASAPVKVEKPAAAVNVAPANVGNGASTSNGGNGTNGTNAVTSANRSNLMHGEKEASVVGGANGAKPVPVS
jgi:cytoskeletal protein CcmA (bactofilin family)